MDEYYLDVVAVVVQRRRSDSVEIAIGIAIGIAGEGSEIVVVDSAVVPVADVSAVVVVVVVIVDHLAVESTDSEVAQKAHYHFSR